MTDRLPLAEVSGDEAIARITYQIILGDYDLHPDAYDNPSFHLFELAAGWQLAGVPPVAEQLRLAGIWVANGGTIATWLRSRIVFRARTVGSRHRVT
jgi:hypothetical protein